MFNPQILRRISMVVLVTFTSLTMQPLQAAVQLQRKLEQSGLTPVPHQPLMPARSQADSNDQRLSNALAELDNLLKEIVPKAGQLQTSIKQPAHKQAKRSKIAKKDKKGKLAKAPKRRMVTRALGPNMRIRIAEDEQPLPGVDLAQSIKPSIGKRLNKICTKK